MLSFVNAPYAVRVHSAADALAKVAVMRRYNAAHNQNGNAFTDVCLVRAAPLRCARRADAPLRRTAALQAMATSSNGAAVKAAIDLPEGEGAGWTNDNRFAFTATPELVIHFRWVVPNFTPDSSDGDSRVTLRHLGGVMTVSIYLDIQRLPRAGDDLLADAGVLEAMAAAPPRRQLRSAVHWAEALMD